MRTVNAKNNAYLPQVQHDSIWKSLTSDKDTTWHNQQLFLAPTKEVVKQKYLSKN